MFLILSKNSISLLTIKVFFLCYNLFQFHIIFHSLWVFNLEYSCYYSISDFKFYSYNDLELLRRINKSLKRREAPDSSFALVRAHQ